MKNTQINADRLWDSLMELARIGATPKGGVCRLALTDVDKQGRDLFVRWCEDAGCSVSYDAMGNIFARRPDREIEARSRFEVVVTRCITRFEGSTRGG